MASPPRGQYYDVAGYNSGGGVFALVTTTRVTVYVAQPYAAAPQTTLASIFSAETGAGTPGNPFNATSGEINFWAAPGSYDIKIEDTGVPAKFATKILRWDVLPADEGVAANTMLTDLSIDSTKYAAGSIVSGKLAAASVGASEIIDGSVGTAELANLAVTLGKMAADSVDSSKIVNGSIALGDLAAGLQNLVVADVGAGYRLRAFSQDIALGTGWQTVTVNYGTTFSGVAWAAAIPYPLTNGAAVPDWNSNGYTNTYASLNVNNSLAQTVRFLGLALAG